MDHELGGTGLELIENRQEAALTIASGEQTEPPKVVSTAEPPVVGVPVCETPRGSE